MSNIFDAVQARDLKQVEDCLLAGVEFLLLKGADIEAKDKKTGYTTPLLHAAYKGNLKMVEFLVSKGANIEAKDNRGYTPLLKAAYKGDLKMVEFLVSKGANIEAKDNRGRTPLLEAEYKGDLKMVEFLVSKRVNLAAKNNAGKGVLALAKKEEVSNFIRKTLRERIIPILEKLFIKDLAGIVANFLY